MSRKSRQPDADDGAGGKRGAGDKRGKKRKAKGTGDATGTSRVVVSERTGVPFSVVVLFAALMVLPSVSNHLAGGLTFAALMIRAFAALAVAWLLSHLVFAVFTAMKPEPDPRVDDAGAGASGEGSFAGFDDGFDDGSGMALSGTIVGDDDPFALPPLDDPLALEPLPPLDLASSPQD